MQIEELIATRRTVHEFAAAPIPDGAVDRSLAAAHWAPNHKLTWPWRFTKVGPKARAQLIEIGIALKSAKRQLPPEMVKKLRAKLGNPAELVVVSQMRSEDGFRSREDYGAVACAIQNMTLSLWSEGISTKWGTGGITRHDKTYALLGIDGNTEEIVGFIWIGHPVRPSKAPQRPPLADVIREVP